MYKSIFLIFLPIYLISASIDINILRDNNQTYSIIHLRDSADIVCEVKMNDAFKDILICEFLGESLKKRELVENRFFKLDFSSKAVRITPKYHFDYYPFQETFIRDNELHAKSTNRYPHWIVVGYEKTTDIYHKKSKTGLGFPIEFASSAFPSIGELDFDLNPIVKTSNASALVKIKEAYRRKQYRKVLQLVEQFSDEEKTVFTDEAKLYKIRALDKIINDARTKEDDDGLDPMEIVDLAEVWVEDNPSSVILPEIYMIVAKTYLKMGRANKAKKYLDILENEYTKSRYNFLAKLTQADKIYKIKSKDEGISLFKKVLYGTEDFDIASMAAMRLSEAYLAKQEVKKAKDFLEKVVESNSAFIITHANDAYALAKRFADNNESNLSLQVALKVQKNLKDSMIDEDELKKNIAFWYEKSSNIDMAVQLYKAYLDEEKYGRYRDFISERLDKSMVNSTEENETKKLAFLESVMQKYKGEGIYAKALLAKADIYLKNGKFEKILSLKEDLKKYGGEALLKEVAKKEQERLYEEDKCKKAIELENEYNLTVAPKYEKKAFSCYVKQSAYQKALAMAKEKLKSEDLEEKLAWSYGAAKLYYKQGKYKSLILAATDVEKLQKLVENSGYDDLIYEKIEGYYYLGNYDELMLKEVQKCEKLFPGAIKNLDVFEKVLMYAKKNQDTSLLLNYAKKMIELQEQYHIETYTPKLQLDYIKALRDKGRDKEALKVVLKLLYKKLNDTQRAHVLYLAGDLSEKQGNIKEAKGFYAKCGEIVDDSAWVELCSENLQLLE